MRHVTRSTRWPLGLGLLLVGSLLLAPAAWASEEDVREQGAAAKSDQKEKADDAKREDVSAEKPEAVSGATSDETTGQMSVDPSLNTLEDILAYRGPLDTLWTPRSAPAPRVTWRDVDARPAETD